MSTRRPLQLVTAAALLLGQCLPAAAEPFPLRNSSPLARVIGLPAAQPARLTEPGTTVASLLVSVASHSSSASAGGELLLLDGETWQTTLSLRRALTSGLEIGLDLPYVVHENGILDPAIDAFHRATGLPPGERDSMATNQLAFFYRPDRDRELRLDNPASGLGDAMLYAAWPMSESRQPGTAALSLQAALKLPTGNSDKLLGSGGADLSLALAGSRPFRFAGFNAQLYGRAGVLAPAVVGNAKLKELQKDLAGFLSVTAVWHRWPRLSIKLQLDSNTALWSSDIGDLGSPPVQLVVGGVWWSSTERQTSNSVEFGFGEDLAIDRSPDIVFFVNWRRHY